MANVFLTRMPAGIPGTVNRTIPPTIEVTQIDPTNPPVSYGVPVAIDATSHLARGILNGDAAAAIYGMMVKPFPIQENTVAPVFGTATPPTSGPGDILKSGYMSVHVGGTTNPVKNGIVYVRVAAAAGGKPIGGIEAASDSTNTIIMANAYFTGPADAGFNSEIAFNV